MNILFIKNEGYVKGLLEAEFVTWQRRTILVQKGCGVPTVKSAS